MRTFRIMLPLYLFHKSVLFTIRAFEIIWFKFFTSSFLLFQLRPFHATIPDNDGDMAISFAVLVELRRSSLRVHSSQPVTRYSCVLCVCATSVPCDIFVKEKLLLCGACTHRRMGRRDDTDEWL